jgi:hypothetical protein
MELRPYQIPIFNDNTTGILGADRFPSDSLLIARCSPLISFGKYTKEQLEAAKLAAC